MKFRVSVGKNKDQEKCFYIEYYHIDYKSNGSCYNIYHFLSWNYDEYKQRALCYNGYETV